jgi:class 3 adenylate cyclase/tetratricopeptide (TPR) repeat protein
MKCAKCQHENRPGAKFCEECAAPLARACVNCGAQLTPSAKFCSECAFPASQATPAMPQRFAAPDRYTPKHLAEKILHSKAALEGERKQVTVLFADIKGSMELIADRDPEEARRLLDPVLEHMMEAVHRYEGTVNHVLGDGIMALFGAPLAHEDHAVRACYAALRMQDAIRRHGEEVRRTAGVSIQIRVGLNSGEVVVRSIDSDLRMDYTAVGQTTHLAARMEQMAMAGSILISADTFRLAEDFIEVHPLGPVAVKGLDKAVEAYEVSGGGLARRRFDASALRGLTSFVGRAQEMEQLTRSLEHARTGHGQVVAVVGEPGVGKSRLFYEFTHSQRTAGWLMLASGSVSYGKATPYLPLIDLLKAYFQIEPRDDARRVREKATGKLLALDRSLEPALPAFLSLLDVPVEDLHWQALDPSQRRQRTLDTCKLLLLRESRMQPLLLVFEDLHWIDNETQAFLDSLVESLPGARLLLIINYRPEYEHHWGSKTYYAQLRIDPLGPEHAEKLLDVLLGGEAALAPLKRLLIQRTEGNPFFLEESVRSLVDTRVLLGERGAYRLAQSLATIQVPATVQAVLAARIDRLPAEEKHLVQAAAVIGKDVPFVLLQAIADQPEEALRKGLVHLQTAEVLYEASLFPELEYAFKHGLTYQVAYESLLQERRRVLHAGIVEAIEQLYPERLVEYIERLAHHALRGEVWEKAVSYLHQAGVKAFAHSANRDAVTYFEQALEALKHLPETHEIREQAVDLRFSLRNSLYPLGEIEKGFQYLHEAERQAKALDDPRRLGWVSLYMSQYRWVTGDSKKARPLGENALTIAETLKDFPLQVAANFYLGVAWLSAGDYGRAEDILRKTVQLVDGERSRERCGLAGFPTVILRSWLAFSLAEHGDFDEGIAYGREGIRFAEALDHPFSLAHVCYDLGYLYSVKGEISDAVRLIERALALSREWNLAFLLPITAGFLGHVHALSGRVAEGLPLLDEALNRLENIGLGFLHSLLLIQLGGASMSADRFEEAHAMASRALNLTQARGERGYEARALHLLGEIAAHSDPPDIQTAGSHYSQALVLASELGMRPLIAHCHLGLGKLYRRTNDGEKAREQLAIATRMYRDLDMRFWLEQLEAEMRGLV